MNHRDLLKRALDLLIPVYGYSEEGNAIIDGLQAELDKLPDDGWRPIATAPPGKPILVFYRPILGRGGIIIKAKYVAKFTEEAAGYDWDTDVKTDYDEENDKYYLPEGWIELIDNWDDYSSVYFEQPLTHWMPLPAHPEEDAS